MQETYSPTKEKQSYSKQQRMPVPPREITTKDLAYLKDAMSWELLAMKKCNHFAQECQNNEIKSAINRTGKLHKRHYKILLSHLNTNRNFNRY